MSPGVSVPPWSGGYPQPPEANLKDNGFPWPPPGLLGFFLFLFKGNHDRERRALRKGGAVTVQAESKAGSCTDNLTENFCSLTKLLCLFW